MDLIDFDPLTGLSLYMDYRSDQDITFRHEQDCSRILDANAALANDDDVTKTGIKNDWWKYASIPDVLWIKWRHEEGLDIFNPDHQKALFQKLNSPEYRRLKTTGKKHA